MQTMIDVLRYVGQIRAGTFNVDCEAFAIAKRIAHSSSIHDALIAYIDSALIKIYPSADVRLEKLLILYDIITDFMVKAAIFRLMVKYAI